MTRTGVTMALAISSGVDVHADIRVKLSLARLVGVFLDADDGRLCAAHLPLGVVI